MPVGDHNTMTAQPRNRAPLLAGLIVTAAFFLTALSPGASALDSSQNKKALVMNIAYWETDCPSPLNAPCYATPHGNHGTAYPSAGHGWLYMNGANVDECSWPTSTPTNMVEFRCSTTGGGIELLDKQCATAQAVTDTPLYHLEGSKVLVCN